MTSNIKIILYSFLLVLVTVRCGIYSFSGVATSAKTITIDQFYNSTDLASANIGPTFTNRLKDYFQQNTTLRVVSENGDLHLEGTINVYEINSNLAPTSTGDPNKPNLSALSRLTIGMKISFQDTKEPNNNFKDRSFSFFSDFDNTKDFPNIQSDLEDEIFKQILTNLFNATVGNW